MALLVLEFLSGNCLVNSWRRGGEFDFKLVIYLGDTLLLALSPSNPDLAATSAAVALRTRSLPPDPAPRR